MTYMHILRPIYRALTSCSHTSAIKLLFGFVLVVIECYKCFKAEARQVLTRSPRKMAEGFDSAIRSHRRCMFYRLSRNVNS
jgi:hypothetical protein